MVNVEITPSSAFPGMIDVSVSIGERSLKLLCNNLEDALLVLERDAESIQFLLS